MTAPAAPDLSVVSIVALSYNRIDVIERNVAALADLASKTGCELIVVDNASTDGSRERIRAALNACPEAHFIENDRNLGVAGGRNTGWLMATREFVLNIDDDTFVVAEDIVALVSLMRKYPMVGIVSPRIIHPETEARQLDLGDALVSIANFHGACHLVRADLIRQIGFNDDLCTFGGEELDYSIRARGAGYDVVYTPDATVMHNNLERSGADGASRRAQWIFNFVRVYYKSFPAGFATTLTLRTSLSHIASGLRPYGLRFPTTVVKSVVSGLRAGSRQRELVPREVVQFYRNPDLRPEFGNKPVWRKLVGLVGTNRGRIDI